MAASFINVADLARITGGTSQQTVPILSNPAPRGSGGEQIAAGRPCILRVNRGRDGTTGALDGTIAVYGANLPHPEAMSEAQGRIFRGDAAANGATRTKYDLSASILYRAFSNYNIIVIINGVVLAQGAGAGKYTLTDNADGTSTSLPLRILLGTAAAATDIIEVYLVTPVQLMASGAHEIERAGIVGKSLYWVDYAVASTNLSRTLVTVEADPATGG